ncbi:exported hypothetical protein [Candidatus Sulfopaludibacter sp. SbA4]|nr:exported hypothetical protein [Candidatus Sulfopaludibacter sp. SbA4]
MAKPIYVTSTALALFVVSGLSTAAFGQSCKEYMRLGGRVVAIENQCALSVSASANPTSGTSSTFTVSVADYNGSQNVAQAFFLINYLYLNGANSCYLSYIPGTASNSGLYLLNDPGNQWHGPYPSAQYPSPQSLSQPAPPYDSYGNSQCTITSVNYSPGGNIANLTLGVNFSSSFAGTKVLFGTAADTLGQTWPWQAVGFFSVPGPSVSGPSVTGMSPVTTFGWTGSVTTTFYDTNGWSNDGNVVDVLVNNSLNGSQACYLALSPSINTIYLLNDAGTAIGGSITLPTSATTSNSQCTVNGVGTSFSISGNTLTLTVNLSFSPPFGGDSDLLPRRI